MAMNNRETYKRQSNKGWMSPYCLSDGYDNNLRARKGNGISKRA
ncbi:uncharacterized protein G2W53_009648 [Senna tora]|uniref:Uncharacterized protein n=1 Tax=Senna tora TaxID=362788 RepID=A0A834WYB1_9FABA|nr:uncharacterized protein G2W53_009648 [Senna tora]